MMMIDNDHSGGDDVKDYDNYDDGDGDDDDDGRQKI